MRLTIVLLSLVFTLNIFAQEDKVKGFYLTEEKEAKIKIFKATDGKYYGKFVWLKNADKKDIHNPDPAKHDTPLQGMMLMKEFTYNAKTQKWENGQIYDPKTGKMYSCYMWFEDNENELHIRGFVMGMKMLGSTTVWTRTEE